jgi:hypothetical protein
MALLRTPGDLLFAVATATTSLDAALTAWKQMLDKNGILSTMDRYQLGTEVAAHAARLVGRTRKSRLRE